MHPSVLRRLSLSLTLLAAHCAPALADEPAWLGAADCRIAPLKERPSGEVSWTGGCVDGYASGKGVLAFTWKVGKVTLEATLVRGKVSGEALFRTRNFSYAGAVRDGVPHGEGYSQHEGRGWYEGEFVDGLPHGKGTYLRIDRSRYTGEWVHGARQGHGEASFGTGGSYTGSWKDGAFDGQGAIVYAGAGHKYEGRFEDGRVAGLPKPAFAEDQDALKGKVTGTDTREERVPLKARWNELTSAQKDTFRKYYPALEAGDEPPFPAEGEGVLFDKVDRINATFGPVQGDLFVYVLVGKDGKPLSVTAYGAPTATIVRALSELFMREQYKPALCRGEPCEMVYPVNISFIVSD